MVEILQQGKVIEWLLEDENPSVKYWTLLDLQYKSPEDEEVVNTRGQIMVSDCVRSILGHQIESTYWSDPQDMYNPKYKATTHNLLILAELGTDLVPEIENAIEHIFLFQRDSGHFLMKMPKTAKGRASKVFDGCCLDGNILTYLNHFGYAHDGRVRKLLQFIIDYYDNESTGWPCRAFPIDMAKVIPSNCYMGRMKVLKGLSKLPEVLISQGLQNIIDRETNYILQNNIWYYLKDTDGSPKEKRGWKKFGFPLFYNSDILEILDILMSLKIKDERMQPAIEFVRSQQGEDGKWIMQHSFNNKMLCDFEEKNLPSKWITLRALRILDRYTNL